MVNNRRDCLILALLQIYPEGKMTQHMAKLGVGDTLEVKG